MRAPREVPTFSPAYFILTPSLCSSMLLDAVDRHMFGLSMLVDKREDAPSLFSDEAYKRAKTWRVSTSHLTHPKFDNWGWGEVVPDGVGVAYSIHPNRCVFNVTARKDTGYSQRLAYLLEEALVEMRQLLEKEMLGGGEGRSKL